MFKISIFKMIVFSISIGDTLCSNTVSPTTNPQIKYKPQFEKGDLFLMDICKGVSELQIANKNSNLVISAYIELYRNVYSKVIESNRTKDSSANIMTNKEKFIIDYFLEFIKKSVFVRMFTNKDSQKKILSGSKDINNYMSGNKDMFVEEIKEEIEFYKKLLKSTQQSKIIDGTNLYSDFEYVQQYAEHYTNIVNNHTSSSSTTIDLNKPFITIEVKSELAPNIHLMYTSQSQKLLFKNIDDTIDELKNMKKTLEENTYQSSYDTMNIEKKIKRELQLNNSYDYKNMSMQTLYYHSKRLSDASHEIENEIRSLTLKIKPPASFNKTIERIHSWKNESSFSQTRNVFGGICIFVIFLLFVISLDYYKAPPSSPVPSTQLIMQLSRENSSNLS